MALRFAFVLLFSVCAFGLGIAAPAFPDEKCGFNAEYLTCGSACVADCANPEEPKICTMQCVRGCFCKRGFLKNINGECVPKEHCDASNFKIHNQIPVAMATEGKCASDREMYTSECGNQLDCMATCGTPLPFLIHGAPQMPKRCSEMKCAPSCICMHPYVRNTKGQCVERKECDHQTNEATMLFAYPPEMSQCTENEVFLRCGSACPPTCANPRPGACTKQCVAGCFCKPGYLKNEQGVCMKSENCGVPAEDAMPMPPMVCEANEEYRDCKGCDGTCRNPNPICPRICIRGCACKEGYLRADNGKCVMTRECSTMPQPEAFMMMPPKMQCLQNEEFHACGTACPATCENPIPGPACTRNCVIGCFCKPGYLKNSMGKCVMAANCEAAPAPIAFNAMTTEGKCASDREFYTTECGSQLDCMATCGTPVPFLIHGAPQVPKRCSEMKCAPSCVCMHPYVRNTKGQCVERKECDHATPFTTTPSH